MEQFLVILRGTPASGKSTLAKKFRDFSKKIAWLKVDNYKDFFSEDGSVALEYVNGASVATLKYLLGQGFSVVMEGVFQDTKAIDQALLFAKEKNVKTIIYQLKCSLSTLRERDKERPGIKEGVRKPMDEHALEEIFQKLSQNVYPSVQVLDTENQTLDQCLQKINIDLENFSN